MSLSPQQFGGMLREAREAYNLTQEEVAEELGTSKTQVCRWECGTCLPSPFYRQKLRALFQQAWLPHDPYLTKKQLERLQALAGREGLAIEELVRRAVDAFLAWDDPAYRPPPPPSHTQKLTFSHEFP